MKNHIYDALNILIELSREFQNSHHRINLKINPKSWAKEFCTVKVCSSRGSGHTESIVKLIEDGMNIGCFFPNHRMASMFRRDYKDRIKKSKNGKLVFCIGSNISSLEGGQFFDLDAVAIDVPEFFSSEKIDKIYNTILPNVLEKEFFFIFVG